MDRQSDSKLCEDKIKEVVQSQSTSKEGEGTDKARVGVGERVASGACCVTAQHYCSNRHAHWLCVPKALVSPSLAVGSTPLVALRRVTGG